MSIRVQSRVSVDGELGTVVVFGGMKALVSFDSGSADWFDISVVSLIGEDSES